MLEPNYLQNVGDDLEKLYQELATEILVDIAERIKMNQDAMTKRHGHTFSQAPQRVHFAGSMCAQPS